MNRIVKFAAVLTLLVLSVVPFASSAFAAEAPASGHAAEIRHEDGHGEGNGVTHEAGPGPIESPDSGPLMHRSIWTLTGILASAFILSGLYFVKKAVGGFPKNPTWVAPITIMPSKGFTQDSGDSHGHDDHGAGHHAPAH